jgi:hypothetical protein
MIGGERRLRASLSFVVRLVVADGVEPVEVFELVSDLGLLEAELPRVHASDGEALPAIVEIALSLRPNNVLADIGVSAGILPAHTREDGTIGVFVLDGMVIENLAVNFLVPALPSANALSADWIAAL